MAVPTGRPPGRPPLRRGDPSVSMHVRLPTSDYDRLEQRAQAARVTVPELVRRRLAGDDDEEGEDE